MIIERNIEKIPSGYRVRVIRRIDGKPGSISKVLDTLKAARAFRNEAEKTHPKRMPGRPSTCPRGLSPREHHLANIRKGCQSRREMLLAEHCCLNCKAPLPPEETRKHCAPCRDFRNAKYRANYAAR